MPDLLFLSQRLPFPPSKGEKIRAYHEIRYLSRWYDIHLGCLADDPADLGHIEALRPFCRSIHVALLGPHTARCNCLLGLLTGQPLSVAWFRNKGLATWVRDVVERVRPVVTFVYSSNMAPYVLDLPRASVRIADLVDVDSEKWRALAETARGPMRWIYRREQRKIAELERQAVAACDLSLFVSDAEAALFARQVQGHAGRIRGIGNGVDHRFFDPEMRFAAPFDAAVPNFVFTGTMDYRPNIDAVTWFAADILPLIRQSLPAARFCIAGSNPAPAVRRLAQTPGITVTGRVPDVRPYLAHATACVAPMRVARGVQNKVLEAMAMARPVVLTSGALEGISATPEREVLLADTSHGFAEACCRLADPAVGGAIGAAARARVISDHDWDAMLRPLNRLLRPVSSPLLTEPA